MFLILHPHNLLGYSLVLQEKHFLVKIVLLYFQMEIGFTFPPQFIG